jgi:hypothetical protein
VGQAAVVSQRPPAADWGGGGGGAAAPRGGFAPCCAAGGGRACACPLACACACPLHARAPPWHGPRPLGRARPAHPACLPLVCVCRYDPGDVSRAANLLLVRPAPPSPCPDRPALQQRGSSAGALCACTDAARAAPHPPTHPPTDAQAGAVMGRRWQPHESHVPYLLQLKIDFNLAGMGWLRMGHARFRRERCPQKGRGGHWSPPPCVCMQWRHPRAACLSLHRAGRRWPVPEGHTRLRPGWLDQGALPLEEGSVPAGRRPAAGTGRTPARSAGSLPGPGPMLPAALPPARMPSVPPPSAPPVLSPRFAACSARGQRRARQPGPPAVDGLVAAGRLVLVGRWPAAQGEHLRSGAGCLRGGCAQ